MHKTLAAPLCAVFLGLLGSPALAAGPPGVGSVDPATKMTVIEKKSTIAIDPVTAAPIKAIQTVSVSNDANPTVPVRATIHEAGGTRTVTGKSAPMTPSPSYVPPTFKYKSVWTKYKAALIAQGIAVPDMNCSGCDGGGGPPPICYHYSLWHVQSALWRDAPGFGLLYTYDSVKGILWMDDIPNCGVYGIVGISMDDADSWNDYNDYPFEVWYHYNWDDAMWNQVGGIGYVSYQSSWRGIMHYHVWSPFVCQWGCEWTTYPVHDWAAFTWRGPEVYEATAPGI